jgi:CHAT domain-containing protein/Tfp pilus assembly protein PilF
MKLCHSIAWVCLSLCLSASTILDRKANPQAAPGLNNGVVVESLVAGFEAEKAGIKPGDVLLEWSRGDKRGEITSPFDLNYLRVEEASRATVKLDGVRGAEKRSWLLGSNTWAIRARPNFQEDLLSIYHEANTLAQAGKLAQAVGRWKEVSNLFEDPATPWLGPWFLSHLAQLSSNHSWEGYDDTYREAIQEAVPAGAMVKAELLKQWAGGFSIRGDLNSAEKYYQEAITEYRRLGLRTMSVSNAEKEQGVYAYFQGNMSKAEEYFRESFSIAEELAPRSIQVVWNLIWFGVLSQERGDFTSAEGYYKKALSIEQQAFPASSDLALTLQNLGTLAHRRGNLAQAEDYYRRSIVVAEKLGPDSQYLPDILSNLAECVLDRGNPDAAEKYEIQALSIREKQADGDLAIAFSFRNLGKIARIRGDLGKADEYYHRGLAIMEKSTPTSPSITRFLVGLGYVERDRGDFQKAAEYYRSALTIMEKVAPTSLDHAETLADLAGALRGQQQLDVAAQVYKQALGEMENKTARLGGVDEDRSRYRAQHDRYYREYVDVLVAQGQPTLAFQVLEGSRARTLFEVLSRANINVRGEVNLSLIDSERKLQQLRNAKSAYRLRLLSDKHTNEQVAAVDKEIHDLLDQYQQVEAEIRVKSPGYAALTQPQPLGAKEIQQLLDANTLLLEYSLGEARSYVWAVSEGSLVAYELPKRAEIETAARHVYELLAAQKLTMGNKSNSEAQIAAHWARMASEYPKAAMDLSRMVLGPVAALLKGKRLLVVSEGALQYVPFSALPFPEAASSAESKLPSPKNAAGARANLPAANQAPVPLIVEHEIVNLPSASVLAELRRQAMGRPKPPKAVAVLADPVFASTDERVEIRPRSNQNGTRPTAELPTVAKASLSADQLTRSLADVAGNKNERFYLKRLLYTRREAKAIMAVTPATGRMKALDFQANRTTATSADLGQYRIVHFATHGLLNNEHPELSGLVLSLVNNRGQPQDGFLELEDIYNLHLPVELVVLSACETGLGQEMNGEGLVSLTRGFMYAGATRVVASLWNVNDAATSELMARFYKEMQQEKVKPAAALRAAQIQMWKQKMWMSPYYWAAFQIQGDWR